MRACCTTTAGRHERQWGFMPKQALLVEGLPERRSGPQGVEATVPTPRQTGLQGGTWQAAVVAHAAGKHSATSLRCCEEKQRTTTHRQDPIILHSKLVCRRVQSSQAGPVSVNFVTTPISGLQKLASFSSCFQDTTRQFPASLATRRHRLPRRRTGRSTHTDALRQHCARHRELY